MNSQRAQMCVICENDSLSATCWRPECVRNCRGPGPLQFLAHSGRQHAAALGVCCRRSLLTQRRCLPQIDHLAGRSGGYSPTAPVKSSGSATNPHEGRVEVIVRGSGTVKVAVDWQRGGQTAAEVTVDADAPASSL